MTQLEEIIGAQESKKEVSLLTYAMGQVREHQLNRPDLGIADYQRAFKTWHKNFEALAAARATYAKSQKWQMVFRLFDLELQVRKDPKEQAVVYLEMARLCFTLDGMGDKGYEHLEKAMDLDPDNEDALELLEQAEEEDLPVATEPEEAEAVETEAVEAEAEEEEAQAVAEEAEAEEEAEVVAEEAEAEVEAEVVAEEAEAVAEEAEAEEEAEVVAEEEGRG